MQNLIQKLLFTAKENAEKADHTLVTNLIIIEDYIRERFYLKLRIIIVVFFSLGYFLNNNVESTNTNIQKVVIGIILLQLLIVILYQIDKLFSRKLITTSITLDGLSILFLFFSISYFIEYENAVNSEVLVYLHVIFLVTQVIRISKVYIVYAAIILFVGRIMIYFYFKYFSLQLVHFSGSTMSAFVRYLSLGIIIIIVFYTSSRLKRIAYKAINEYLIKNNLILKNKQLYQLAIIDQLTDLYIRRYFQIALTREMERASRYKKPLSILLIDIDNFKDINDKFGHPRGDDILKAVAYILKYESRPYDICARYGGDEFAIILPETSKTTAMFVAERMRKKVEKKFQKRKTVVTLSIGVSAYTGHVKKDSKKLITSADKALYTAKEKGRNQVCFL
jgi:diguanylate cyclase (GGDEF)-like protein